MATVLGSTMKVIQDERTPLLGLQLPHPENVLEEDVLRLRAAFLEIDSVLGRVRSVLESDDVSLDTLQEIATALKAAQNGLAGKASTSELSALQSSVSAELQRLQQRIAAIPANRHRVGSVSGPQPGESGFRFPSGTVDGEGLDVDGLGRFCWSSTSTDPVDSETCLLAIGGEGSKPGRWLLVEPDWQAVLSELFRITDWLELEKDRLEQKVDVGFAEHTRRFSEHDARLSTLRTEFETVGHVLTTTATLTFPSIAAYGGRQDVPVSLPGVGVGDVVQVSCSTLVDGLFPSGFVAGADVVTVRLLNAKNSAVTPASAEYLITAVGVSRRIG